MKRLTSELTQWNVACGRRIFVEKGRLAERLAAIEDILGDDYDLERLKELVELVKNIPHVCKFCVGCEMEPKDGHGCDEYDSFVFSTRRLQELADADRDGRCVVLPCKVDDKVYVNIMEKTFPFTVISISQITATPTYKAMHGVQLCLIFKSWDIGKTVFLTREAAEAALKGEKDG